jgi:hypothetical protein
MINKKIALSFVVKNIVPIISVLVAIAALIMAFAANNLASKSIKNAETANELSTEANKIAKEASQTADNALKLNYKSYQPVIDGKCTTKYDIDGNQTESITMVNNGEPITELIPTTEVFIGIIINKIGEGNNKQITLYLPLFDYFLPIEKASSTKETLFTVPGKNGNHSKFALIRSTFFEAGAKDRYITDLYIKNLVRLDFINKLDKKCVLFYSVGDLAAFKITSEDFSRIQSLASNNILSAANAGAMPNIDTLDGTKLWYWCKRQFLE